MTKAQMFPTLIIVINIALFGGASKGSVAPLLSFFEQFLIYGLFAVLSVEFFDKVFAHVVDLYGYIAAGIFDGALIVDLMFDANKHLLGHIEQIANSLSFGIIPVLFISEALYVAVFIVVNLPDNAYALFIAVVLLKFVQVIHGRFLATDLSGIINRRSGYPYTRGKHDHCNQLQCIGGTKRHSESFVYFSEHNQSPSLLSAESCGSVAVWSTNSSMMCANVYRPLDNMIAHSTTKGDLTAISDTDYTCRAGAIVPAGFDDSIVSGGHNHHALFGGFFVSVALCAQLVGRVWEAHACRFPFTPVRQPILGSPFLFDDEKGEYINENGAIIMANQSGTPQAESAHSSTNTTKSNTVPLNMAEALNQMRIFGLDIRALQVDTAHPVRCRACSEQGRRGWYMLHATPMQTGGPLLIGTYGIWRGDVNDMRRVLIPAQFLKAVHA